MEAKTSDGASCNAPGPRRSDVDHTKTTPMGSLHRISGSRNVEQRDRMLIRLTRKKDDIPSRNRTNEPMFDPNVAANVGGNVNTNCNVLFDSGFIHGRLEVCSLDMAQRILSADIVDGQLSYTVVKEWTDYSQLSKKELARKGREITVANKATIKSVGTLSVTLHFEDSENDIFRLDVKLHVFKELTCDIILSNHTLASVADIFALDYKNRRILFLNETDSETWSVKASIPAKSESWRTTAQMLAMRFHVPKPLTLITTKPVRVGVGEIFYIQVELPGQSTPLVSSAMLESRRNKNQTKKGISANVGSDLKPLLVKAKGDIPTDKDNKYVVRSLSEYTGSLPYQVQSAYGMSVLVETNQPQCIAIINNTDTCHVVPAGTAVALLESERDAFNVTEEDGLITIPLGEIMEDLSKELEQSQRATEFQYSKNRVDQPYSVGERLVLTSGPRHKQVASLCYVVEVKQRRHTIKVKDSCGTLRNVASGLKRKKGENHHLSRLCNLGAVATTPTSHLAPTPTHSADEPTPPTKMEEGVGLKLPTFKVGEQAVFTRGPRHNAISSVCRVISVDDSISDKPIYTLLDGDNESLICEWANPLNSLARIETLADGIESPGFRRINVKTEAQPETEVLIDEDASQPPCPIPGIKPANEPRPWFKRPTTEDLEEKSNGNYIPPTKDLVEEMMRSEMWEKMQKSDVYLNGAKWLQDLVKDVLLPHAGGMALNAPAAATSISLHDITLKKDAIAVSRQYPLSPEARQQIEIWLRKMLANGFIKRVDSPYRSPLLVVAKKDSGGKITGWRVCFDARKINSLTVDLPGNPAPTAAYLWSEMAGSIVFSKTDLKDAFYSVRTTDRATKITAFVDPRTGRQYGFTRMPMGLAGSPATMQRVTSEAFADLLGICAYCYVDDLVVYSKQSHVDEVKQAWRTNPVMRENWRRRTNLDKWGHLESQAKGRLEPEEKVTVDDTINHLEGQKTTVDDILRDETLIRGPIEADLPDTNHRSLSREHLAKLHTMATPTLRNADIGALTSLPTACLFAGIAGLSVGKVNMYCENDDMAVSILKARMRDGTIPKADIQGDVTALTRLKPGTKLIVAGFPCQDFSLAGKQTGFKGKNGQLFWQIPRLVEQSIRDADPVEWLFLENVSAILAKERQWRPIYESLSKLGFDGEHIVVSAAQAGLPHRRRRWFSLWKRSRQPNSALPFNLPSGKLSPCGSIIEGTYRQRVQVNIPLCELNPPLNLQPWDQHKYPCRKDATPIKRWPLNRRLYATPRTRGGNDNGRNLTERGSADIATQLKFDSTSVKEGDAVGNQVSADFVEHIMGFATGYTKLQPLKHKQHSGCFRNGINFLPRGVNKLVPRTSLNTKRLFVLGNSCSPPQSALALQLLVTRFEESRRSSQIRKEHSERQPPGWVPYDSLQHQWDKSGATVHSIQPISAMTRTIELKDQSQADRTPSKIPARNSQKVDAEGMTEDDYLLLTHIMQLSSLLSRILFAGLRAQTKKTRVLAREIKILGHLLSDEGLRPCPDKCKAISQMPSPTSQSHVRRALGAFSWFRRFIPKYSKRTRNMRALLKKDVVFQWIDPDHEKEFRDIISILCSAPLVVCPDPTRQVLVATDASAAGLGGVVYQLGDDPNDIRIIGYYSRSTTSAEKNYDARELETLAVLSTLEKYRAYIPRHVTVLSDHQALGVLDSYVKSNHRLARWSVRLSMWTPNIVHRAGKDMELPDWISRAPIAESTAPVINLLDACYEDSTNYTGETKSHTPMQSESERVTDSASLGLNYNYLEVDSLLGIINPNDGAKPNLTLHVITNKAGGHKRLVANGNDTVLVTGHTCHVPGFENQLHSITSSGTPSINTMRTRPRTITKVAILNSQISDRKLRFVRAYLQMARRDKRDAKLLKRQIVRAYNLSKGGRSGSAESKLNSGKKISGRKRTTSSSRQTGQEVGNGRSGTPPTIITEKDILADFCGSFEQAAGQMAAAHEELQKLASTMMMEKDLLVLIQRPINGYLSRSKREYRLDSRGATTDILRERAHVLGRSLTQDAIWFAHSSMEGAHQGYAGVLDYLKRYYYWPTMARDAKQYCKRCRLCQLAKQGRRDRYRTITASNPPTASFQVIYIDLVQIAISNETKSYEGHSHILTICDRLTRFVRFVPIALGIEGDAKALAKLEKARDKAATEEEYEQVSKKIRILGAKRASTIVANALVNEIFLKLHKVPEVIVTDNGSEFHNELMKSLTASLGIKLRFISALNPRSNYVEFIHRPLGNMLKIMVNNHAVFKDVKNWHRYVPYIEHRLNEYKAKGQLYSPAQMILGKTMEIHAPRLRRPGITDEEALHKPTTAEKRQLVEYAKELLHFQLSVERVMHFNIMKRQEEDHERFNKKARYHEYEPGDLVQVYRKKIGSRAKEGLPTKFICPWIGPCTILNKKGHTNVYTVKLNQGGGTIAVTTDRLAPFDPNSFTPAEPNSVWKSQFPRSGSDLWLNTGDQVILTNLPKHWLSNKKHPTRLAPSDFYVAEFLDYQDDDESTTTKGGLRVKLRLKGNSRVDDVFDPYLAKHLNAWKVKSGKRVRPTESKTLFSVTDPDPHHRYEPLEITVRTEQLLPMYAFNLNRDQSIPRQVQKNISALLRHRSSDN